jgi:hypothetical protein
VRLEHHVRSRRTLALSLAASAAMVAVLAVPTSAFAKVTAPSGTTTPTTAQAGKLPSPAPATTVVVARAGTTARSGNWNDPGTWATGQVPGSTSSAAVGAGHVVTVTADVTVAGVTVAAGATLRFDPAANVTLSSSRNVVIDGRLQMRPASAATSHALRFINVNEAAFVGSGMNVIASDVGLWVMGAGQLDLAGAPKTAWTRASGPISAGATSVGVIGAPSGWRAGDDIAIAPTQAPTVGDGSWDGFDQAKVTAVSGTSVSLSTAVTRPHPMVNGQWTAEVMNLTRNVRLEGTPTGRSHVFIRSSRPQTILYTAFRYMGPRQGEEKVLGRYGLHFHYSLDGSRGSQVMGTVVRDTDSHAYVPHQSHGITFKDDISFNTTEDAYWWDPNTTLDKDYDPNEVSHDTTYDHDIAALVKAGNTPYRLSGFTMGAGENNVIRDSVAVGVQGFRDANGFEWPEHGPGVWDFSRGNIAHNNKVDGILNWENGGPTRLIANFVAYYNGEAGIDHGSYFNRYHFENIVLYGNGRSAVDLRAVSGDDLDQTSITPDEQIRFDNVIMDGAGISPNLVFSREHQRSGVNRPILFSNSTFRGAPVAVHMGSNEPYQIDIANSTILTPTDVVFGPDTLPGDKVRIQSSTTSATAITATLRQATAPFASTLDSSLPESSILAPAGGTILSGAVNVVTAGYDMVGVTKVEFRVDGVLRSSAAITSPTFSWSTAGLAQGAHTIQTRAYDAAGNTNESTLVTVFVGSM